jgi:DNA-binding transcriptional LysR family regulator
MKLSGIDANLLVALDALLRERSVTRAAARLGVSQPALSHSLSRLRAHFGDRLLIRRGQQLVLTPRALALAESAAAAAGAFARVFQPRPPFDPGAATGFVLACADLFSLRFVPPILRALRREAPAALLEVRPLAARASEEILSDGVELAFGVFEDLPPTVNQQHLFHDPFVCVVRADHPGIARTLSLASYLRLPHLEVPPAPLARPGDRITRLLAARGLCRRVSARVPTFALAARLLAEGDEVLTMTRRFAEELARLAPLRIVRCPLKLPPLAFSQIWRRTHDDDPAHRWLRDLCARACARSATRHR